MQRCERVIGGILTSFLLEAEFKDELYSGLTLNHLTLQSSPSDRIMENWIFLAVLK